MPLLGRKTDEEKAAHEAAKAQAEATKSAEQAKRQAEAEALRRRTEEHVRGLPKWEYQVKRVGEDKQKGLLGSQRMEQIFNGEGAQGWELVMINEERATFKRLRLPS
jgi:multidrug efflux pump subunit AcrA (membrane-fusion protein)